MNNTIFRSYGVALLRLCIGAIFLYAGIIKARETDAFRADIAGFRIIPEYWIKSIAEGLPFFEAIAGMWFILGWRPRVPALSLLVLSFVFVIAVSQALARGIDVGCGCFGHSGAEQGNLWGALVLDLFLLFATGIVYRAIFARSGPG